MRTPLARDVVSVWMRRAALWTGVLLSACFDPTYPPQRPCGEDGWCPPGQQCMMDGICRFPGGPPPPPPDGAPPDAVARDNASLAALVPSAGNLFPSFEPGVTEYALNVSQLIETISLEARPSHPQAIVRVLAMRDAGVAPEPIPVTSDGQQVFIEVTAPAGNARIYVVTVNRNASIEQSFSVKASNAGASDNFGYHVAMSEDVLAMGAPQESSSATGVNGNPSSDDACHSGAVYVFRRGDSGVLQEAYLKPGASDVGTGCTQNACDECTEDDGVECNECIEFGLFMALDGDTLAVGAYGDDSGVRDNPADKSSIDSGAVYVFRFDQLNKTWVEEAYLKASNLGSNDKFGLRLALDQDVLVVGAPNEDSSSQGVNGEQDDEGAKDSGAVYVFRRNDMGVWTQEAYLKPSNTGAEDQFGYSVAVSGDTIVASAPYEDSVFNDAESSGAVYVFRKEGQTWVESVYLRASNTSAGDLFGYRVAASDGLVVVGAPNEDGNGSQMNSGAAYVFRRNGELWQEIGRLKGSSNGGDEFGYSVSARGDLVAVGARHENDRSGAAYLFHCAVGGGCTRLDFDAATPDADDKFGHGVSLGGNGLLVGAPFEDSDAEDSGAAYLFQ